VLYLLRGLAARGWPVLLATPPDGVLASRAGDLGGARIPVTARGDLDLRAARRLRASLGAADILHLHTGRAHALGLLAAWGRRPRPRLVVSRRVDFPIHGGAAGRLKYRHGVDRFIAVSEAVRRVLLEGGVSEDRVVTVHSGIDPERMRVPPDPAGLRRELSVPQGTKLLGFIGALVGHKAPEHLVAALARLPEGVHGVFAGEGALEADLRRRVRSLNLEPRVHFLGVREDVPRLMRSIDVFVLPSRTEGLGTSVLDAMAAGTPVVATRAGGIPEMVEDAVSGLLVPPDDPEALAGALRRVLNDAALRAGLIRGAAGRLGEFTADRMVEGTLAVYHSVLSGAPG
jgi:glycosyltransferase involved in cell wall biosynthesis